MRVLCCVLMLCGLLTFSERVEAQEKNKEVYKSDNLSINQISNHVYEHVSYLDTESYGKVLCNGMIVVSEGEAIVFDTTTDNKSSIELINWVESILASKIIAVIPTHYHDDNLGGLEEFHRHGIPSYTYLKTIEIAKHNNIVQPQNGFDNFLELKVGNEKIYTEFLGAGHTYDNIIGYFPAENTMFGGCLVKALGSGKGNLAEANTKDWPDTIKKMKQKYPEVKIIIPGHGKRGGVELLDYTINLFE